MNIRRYRAKDFVKISSLFKKTGFDYNLPTRRELIESEVFVDDNDEVIMWLGAKLVPEFYLIMDPSWETPGMRFETFTLLHNHMIDRLADRGIYEGTISVPPQVEKSFGRRLTKLGWLRSKWACFTLVTR